MKLQGSRWTDVVRAYEESLDLLEAARAEYADAVTKTMDEVCERAEKLLAKVELAEGVERTKVQRSKDDGFAQECLYTTLSCEEREWAAVHAWVAAAFGGPRDTLRVGVEVQRPEDLLPWDRAWLEEQMKRVAPGLSPCDVSSLSEREGWTESWAWMTNVDLTSETSAELGAAAIARSCEAAAALAAALADEAEPVRMAFGALRELRRRLEKKPIVKRQKLDPPKSDLGRWWSGTWSLSVRPETINVWVWVAVDPKTQEILYGHGYNEEVLPGLTAWMAKRLGVKAATRAGYPCGVLLDRKALSRAGEADIIARCEEALRAFAELASKASNATTRP